MIGYGWFAELLQTRVVPSLEGLTVVAAVDPSEERLASAASQGLLVSSSLHELIEQHRDAVDAIAVLTPHDSHLEIVRAGADSGLHIFCEKAFAVTSDDCVAMIEACRQAEVTLVVGHMQKLFGPHRRAVQIAASGELGAVRSIHVSGAHWCPVFPGWWRSTDRCGGLLYWTGIHDVDTLRALTGSEVRTVFAATPPHWDDYTDYEDAIAATLVYESGAIASIHAAEQWPLKSFEESFEIDVVLTEGGIRVIPGDARVEWARQSRHARQQASAETFGSFEEMEEAAYRDELEGFVAAIRNREINHHSTKDGLRCVETLEAVYRSVRSGLPELVAHHDLNG